mgnify:CR=1 FL=1
MKQERKQTEKQAEKENTKTKLRDAVAVQNFTESPDALMTMVAEHMLKTRPRKDVAIRPYYQREGIRQQALLGGITISFATVFGATALKSGGKVYVKTAVVSERKEEALLNLKGDHGRVFYDGKELQPEIMDEKGSCYRLEVETEPKDLGIECPFPAKELNLAVSTVYYRGMEAKDYLSHIRLLSPYGTPQMEMEGIGLSAVCPEEVSYRDADFSAPFNREKVQSAIRQINPSPALFVTQPKGGTKALDPFPCRTMVKDVFLRPYLDTCFFGQWFYALMVGNYGLLQAAEYLGRDDWKDYVLASLQIPVQYYEYQKRDKAFFGESTFLQRAMELDNLDAIGAMGMCLAESCKRTGQSDTLALLRILAEAAEKNIPRFADGTYHRESTMWADDTFMSIPFLSRMWEITGETKYLTECVRQLKGFTERLYMEDKKLFSHIYFLKEQTANRIPWGRGNGWVFLSLSDLLYTLYRHEILSKKAKKWTFLKKLLRNFAAGLMTCQDEEGMLHQILDDPTSYQETSCTGMFVIGLSYGVLSGILEEECLEAAKRAMKALEKKCVAPDGTIKGVCRGSWCSMERKYYKELGTVDDDDHGTGIFLWAQVALAQVLEKYQLEENR